MPLRLEQLESRRCLNATWQNPANAYDVNDSDLVEPLDVLLLVNRLNSAIDWQLPESRPDNDYYFDVNGDGLATPLDALRVVNILNKYSGPLQLVGELSPDSDPNANGVVLSSNVLYTGVTLPETRVVAITSAAYASDATQVLETQSDSSGNFQMQIDLLPGLNQIAILAEDPLGRQTSIQRQARFGNVVSDWNATTLNVVREWSTTSDDPYEGRIVPSAPPKVARDLAMIHVAMFDAINAVEGDYGSYLQNPPSNSQASPAAAAASAAYEVASALYPESDEMADWEASLAESLNTIEDGDAKSQGIVLGQSIGQAMLNLRAADGSEDQVDYTPGNEPGDWNRTLPEYLPPLLPQWQFVEPFAVPEISDYRPAAPPSLESAEYATSVDQVMRLGSLDSNERTEDQTEIAIFWADGPGTFTPPGHWNQIASDLADRSQMSLVESARTLALLNLALADAGIAAWDAKYHYDLWRPIDAIRRADEDGNPATTVDADWVPLVLNPPFPTYTSGHSSFSGAADGVLTAVFGDDVAFSTQLDGDSTSLQTSPDGGQIVTRSFNSITEAAEEAGMSRIYGGIHFDFDNTAGLEAGRDIAAYVVQNFLQPAAE